MTLDVAKNTPAHIQVIRCYQCIWKSASDDRRNGDDLTLRAARDYENFSGIENLIESFLAKNPSEHHSALSLGCGAAKDLAKIRKLFPQSMLFGVDTSHEALVRAKNTASKANSNFICASMSHLPFNDNLKFDMLIAGQSLDLEFEEDYLERLLIEATKYSSAESRFYMTFYGTDEVSLELYKCTPIGNLLTELGWEIIHGTKYCHPTFPLAEGVFWVAEKSDTPARTRLLHS